MSNYTQRFLNKENFYLAFKKLRQYLVQANEWYNPVELEAYEAQLPYKIYRLIKEIEENTYTPQAIEPFPFPKKNKGDAQEMRPYFRISLDDQLIWIAIINIIGEAVDTKLPFWNYGNRLYRPLWYELDKDGINSLQKGRVANTSQRLYRKWNQSWPLYRRHISMTIKVMSRNKNFQPEDLYDEKEQLLFEENNSSDPDKNIYFNKTFWPEISIDTLYWAGLDFSRFFPSVDASLVISNMRDILANRNDVGIILDLAEKMLTFPIRNPWDKAYFLKEYGLQKADSFTGLPTGLYAAGFLANLALYKIDQKLQDWIEEKRDLALFKYVDDQVILSTSQEGLLEFLNFYQNLLLAEGKGIKFHPDKMGPTGVFIKDEKGRFALGIPANQHLGNELDVQYPEPLMTHTLKKMSDLNGEDFNLSNEDDLEKAQDDLEHFLIADFSETEIRRDTRMSFGAMKLAQLAKHIQPDFTKLDLSTRDNKEAILNEISAQLRNKKEEEQLVIIEEAKRLKIQTIFSREVEKINKRYHRIFNLLLKACKENPDKIKLWKRTVEFCYYSGYDGIEEILAIINMVEVHDQSRTYLKSYCVLIIQASLIRAYNNVSGSTDFWRSYTSWNFLSNLASLSATFSLINPSIDYPFFQETIFNFEVVSGLAFEILTRIPPVLSLLSLSTVNNKTSFYTHSSKLNPARFNKNNLYVLEQHLCFLLNEVNSQDKPTLWRENIDSLDWNQPISWSLISMYPSLIPFHIFNAIPLIHSKDDSMAMVLSERWNFSGNSGFMYEVFECNQQIKDAFLSKYDKLRYILDTSKEEQNLMEWYKEVIKESSKDRWTDPRLSEWTFLEIISQIADTYAQVPQDPEKILLTGPKLTSFHPANFIIPEKWKANKNTLTWHAWKRRIRSKEKIRIVEDRYLIDDFRYFPSETNWQQRSQWLYGSGETDLIVCLTVLLVQLISKSFSWPITSSKRVFIDELFSKALYSIESEAVSSETRILIGAILSRKEVELYYGEQPIKLSKDKNMVTIADFKTEIRKIQRKLEQYQFSVRDKMPRQLTVINIDAMNMDASTFFHQ
ncbi:RNA-directed DNA polymerase [Desertivirga brevis]|uniref:RNA-directed DNA polymerase n=1 Tax=Desertivirga brevis TaxID=2810310 RepID=UPI001A964B45|nr:RNA-directed DNA polymerase [Pedobacter sp. SYSU D00873]